ncbi:Spc97/Spc98 family of spindle pole body (SBP) component [Arabidopsis thaliana]|uniref:Spc97/Spc98 family of spindle pole body (SBP) component n=1 Tax=Arabidopsis thaliana TaxID=3702 RepID=F4JHF7_ARATH|nr:Spc97/Spc98 family of spindle pole body (SBP) component [Arabidopsis thaliana]NP_001329646.1 Spc97/Spc98 family of spindle pole body (SBP) component [Arabidopsis thaliana]AEE81922.1 Spc97/Spc98 family of spindle pole body (SBP) component [Arabidopsis thaliana]ANM67845.1 Spc97/Spc98 family of spindle pole body (SBP) component [Arabidopsis thaliana]|eukprot:NP_001190646.1 Spc97/Spc98 family of spindle pole body (SBP) component [Arabidopsis thaliana]
MEELSQILKNNRTDDLTWFCSLSESELDLLISLKKLVIRRAKVSGLEDLVADKFDLKMLRSLGLVLMEYVRKRVEDDTSLAPSVVQELSLLDSCNLLKTHVDDTVDIEEILTDICNKNWATKGTRVKIRRRFSKQPGNFHGNRGMTNIVSTVE